MLYGFFPFFIFGFLMTPYPNWMNWEKIPSRFYIPSFLFLAGGVILFYLGLVAGKALLIAGVLFMLAGWGIALLALTQVLIRAKHNDKRHPVVTTLALIMGWLGMAVGRPGALGAADYTEPGGKRDRQKKFR